MVQELVARGAVRVYSTGRRPNPGVEHGVIPLVLDVTDADAVTEAAEKLDDVSIVVNNAVGSFSTAGCSTPRSAISAPSWKPTCSAS